MLSKVAFLFLTVGDVYHEPNWVNYFAGNEEYCSIYVHPKNGVSPQSYFAPYVIEERVPTRWENTMKAQIALLREALKDPNNTKFVILSETTVPITSFKYAYDRILRHPYSEFYYALYPYPAEKPMEMIPPYTSQFYVNYPDKDRAFGDLKPLHKNSTWIVLNRKHAQLMADDSTYIDIFASAPHDTEHYPSSIISYHGLLHEVVKEDLTFVVWCPETVSYPHFYRCIDQDCHVNCLTEAIKDKKALFARKFSQCCSLESLHEYLPEIY